MADNDVNVKFGADTSALDQGTDRAVGDVKEFDAAIDETIRSLQQLKSTLAGGFDTSGLNRARQDIRGAGEDGQRVGGIFGRGGVVQGAIGSMAATIAAAFTVGAITNWVSRTADAAEEMQNLATRIGMGVEETSAWVAINNSAGISAEAFAGSQNTLSRNLAMAQGGAERQAAAFRALGIDITQARSNSELMLQLADRFSQMADGPQKLALAQRLLGQSGAEMIPVLNQGADAIREQMEAAEEAGVTMNDDFLAATQAVDEATDSLNMQVQGMANTLFTELAPVILDVVEGLSGLVRGFMESYRSGGEAKAIMDAITIAIRAVMVAINGFVLTIRLLINAAAIPFVQIFGRALAVIRALGSAMRGDFAGAMDVYNQTIAATNAATQTLINRMGDATQEAVNFQRQIGQNRPNATPSPVGGTGTGEPPVVTDPGAGNRAQREAQRQARERLNIELERIRAEQEANSQNFEFVMQLEDRKVELIRAHYGEESDEYARALRAREQLARRQADVLSNIERERIERQAEIAEDAVETELEISRLRLEARRREIEQARAMGEISAQQELQQLAAINAQEFAMEAEHENQVFQLRLNTLRSALDQDNLRLEERARILGEIESLEAEHANRLAIIQERASQSAANATRDAANATRERWKSVLDPIGQGFSSMFQNVYNGTMSVKQAFLQMLDQMLFRFIDTALQMAVNWAASQLAQTSATQAGAAARTATQTSEAAAGTAIQGQAALGQIMNSAWSAMAGAYSAIASIPYVGPFLAPAVAAGIFAAVAGLAGNIVSSRGGLDRVAEDGQLAELHKDETVLPASFAIPLRGLLGAWQSGARGGAAGLADRSSAAAGAAVSAMGSGDVTLNYQPQNNRKEMSWDEMQRRDSQGMKRWLRNEVRNRRINLGGNS